MIPKHAKIFYFLILSILKPIYILLYHPKIHNKEVLPQTGGCIVYGNHVHILDPGNLCISTHRQVHYLAKEFLFHYPIVGPLFRAVGCIMVKANTSNHDALEEAVHQLEAGKMIGIFPEGRIKTTDVLLEPFKPGAVLMAQRANVPVIPMAITGKYRLFRKGVSVFFGDPVDLTGLSVEDATELLQQRLSDMLQNKN